METKQKVYLVQFDWSVEDEHYTDVYLFSTYEKALNKFKEIINDEQNNEMSWAADAINDKDAYEFFTNFNQNTIEQNEPLYWQIWHKRYDFIYDDLTLREMEVI